MYKYVHKIQSYGMDERRPDEESYIYMAQKDVVCMNSNVSNLVIFLSHRLQKDAFHASY